MRPAQVARLDERQPRYLNATWGSTHVALSQDSALRKCSIRISVVIHTNRVSRVINSQPSGLTFFLGQVQLQPSMGMGTGSWTPEARGDWNGVILRATCKGRLVKKGFVEISLDWRLHETYLNFNMTRSSEEGGPSQGS